MVYQIWKIYKQRSESGLRKRLDVCDCEIPTANLLHIYITYLRYGFITRWHLTVPIQKSIPKTPVPT